MKENVPNPNEKGVLGKVHEELYEKLREEYNLPSKVAEDCYRDAISVYKGWYNNPIAFIGKSLHYNIPINL